MSEKKQVPTFRVFTVSREECFEGPFVAPDRQSIAENITDVFHILRQHDGCLMHVGGWMFIPYHAIVRVERGKNRFQMPWPLTTVTSESSQ